MKRFWADAVEDCSDSVSDEEGAEDESLLGVGYVAGGALRWPRAGNRSGAGSSPGGFASMCVSSLGSGTRGLIFPGDFFAISLALARLNLSIFTSE